MQIPEATFSATSSGLPAPRSHSSQSAQPFTSFLTRATEAQATPDRAREAVEQLVASAFLLPLFEQMRSSSLKADFWEGGPGEDLWRQQHDTVLADRMVSGERFPLVDAILRRYQQHPAWQAGLDRRA